MALNFPDNPSIANENTIVNGVLIERTWEYNKNKNRWEIIKFDNISFDAELPVTNYERDGDIVTDFDIQDLTGA